MPKCKTVFDNDWLTDSRYFNWISKCKANVEEAYCTLCKKSFAIGNGDIYKVLQHKHGGKHAASETCDLVP